MLIYAALAFIGAYSTACWLYESLRTPLQLLFRGLMQLFVRESLSMRYVITGASDGIGKGYANYLASKRMKIVLIARDKAKLNRVAQELTETYGVVTKVLVADFSQVEGVYEHLQKELEPLDIGILVNNVGVSTDYAKCLEEVPKRMLWSLLNVNIVPVTLLCHILVSSMKQRGRGLIINISSLAAAAPTPYIAVYGASKAYVRNFSLALGEELRQHGVDVQTVLPGFVRTNMTTFVAGTLKDKLVVNLLMRLDSFMRYAGFTIGKTDRTCGYWGHGLQFAGLGLLPEFIRILVIKMFINMARLKTNTNFE